MAKIFKDYLTASGHKSEDFSKSKNLENDVAESWFLHTKHDVITQKGTAAHAKNAYREAGYQIVSMNDQSFLAILASHVYLAKVDVIPSPNKGTDILFRSTRI